jgi:hypothetical protein
MCTAAAKIRPVWKYFDQLWRKFDQKWWSNLNCAYSIVFERISAILAENEITGVTYFESLHVKQAN